MRPVRSLFDEAADGYPWSKAVTAAPLRDERYFKFYNTILFPQELGHYNFAVEEGTKLVAAADAQEIDRIRDIARRGYDLSMTLTKATFPYIEAIGADVSQIEIQTERIRNTYWPRHFDFAIDEATATPNNDVEYGPGM